MDRKQIIMDLRLSGKLKGVKPAYGYIRPNMGKIYNQGQSDFIMSMKDGRLYFQKLSFFFHKLKPEGDVDFNLHRFVEYAHICKKICNILYLYDKDGRFLEIFYNKGLPDTIPTQDNILRMVKEFEKMGIKEKRFEDEEGFDDSTEESNQEIRDSEEKK